MCFFFIINLLISIIIIICIYCITYIARRRLYRGPVTGSRRLLADDGPTFGPRSATTGPSPADIGRRSANTVRGRRASTLRKNHFYNNRRATPYVLQDYNYNNQFPPARRRLHASRFTPNVNSKNSCFNSLIYIFFYHFSFIQQGHRISMLSRRLLWRSHGKN